jgi:hypothetical protein
MMEIVINRKDMSRAIEEVLLKGKYRGASKSKTDLINDNVACLIKNRKIILANANHTIATSVSLNCETGIESIDEGTWIFFDAQKAVKYLKAMKDENVTLQTNNGLLNITGSSHISMPLSIEHSGIKGIAKLLTSKIVDGKKGMFGSTEFETVLFLEDGKELSRAIKECSVIGTAAYKLTYDGSETLSISSSNFQDTETYSSTVELIEHKGTPVTIEFSAPLDKFCKGPMYICLKEESPVFLVGAGRKLIVAPYIRGN